MCTLLGEYLNLKIQMLEIQNAWKSEMFSGFMLVFGFVAMIKSKAFTLSYNSNSFFIILWEDKPKFHNKIVRVVNTLCIIIYKSLVHKQVENILLQEKQHKTFFSVN